jgi:outer membrane protein OmpA-like peptidoglycan-associated protein
MDILRTFFLALVLFVYTACDVRQPNARETGALTGGALGAGLGAIVGNQVGNSGAGVAIGGALGALSGGLLGNSMEAQNEQRQRTDKRINEQQRLLDENKKLIEELRSGGADARVTDRGVVVNLPDVLFQFNSSQLNSGARSTVFDIARAVSRSNRHISVEGHTDSVGSYDYNEQLSRERAQNVGFELQSQGVSSRRISIRGYGESRPVASNATASGRQKNRRVEVVIEN